MPHYPGEQRRRWPIVVAVGATAAVIGLLAGWLIGGGSSHASASSAAVCPGNRDDAGRRVAAVCLVTSYFSLENAPPDVRDAGLADLVLPAELDAARQSYRPLDAHVSTEYAAVAATNLASSPTRPDTDATGQAWMAFVDNYKNGSPPLAQWWITTFELRWQDGRWWLNGGVAAQVNATPQTAGRAPRTGFGPGWVAVGRA
jgi:hypothetical protein